MQEHLVPSVGDGLQGGHHTLQQTHPEELKRDSARAQSVAGAAGVDLLNQSTLLVWPMAHRSCFPASGLPRETLPQHTSHPPA